MTDRVCVFLDYQNVYRRARDSFCGVAAPHWEGQVDPWRLAKLLVDRSPYDRSLASVRVYRGQPDSSRDPKGYGAALRQCATWRASGVDVVRRPLAYPRDWPNVLPGERPREKGIDVALAIDFFRMAVEGEYDVGILFSTDTDLKPALEVVANLPDVRAEVAAWSVPDGHSRRLSIAGRRLWCHWLSADDFSVVRDDTDYNIAK